MSEYERLSLELLWLIAKGQLLLIKSTDNSDIAANVIHHDKHLNLMKLRIEKWASAEVASELNSLRQQTEQFNERMSVLQRQITQPDRSE